MNNFTSLDPIGSPLHLIGPKFVRILFDEFHSESWSISRKKAEEFNACDPLNSSYQCAAQLLSSREFSCSRNLDQPLLSSTLNAFDLLVLLHPCSTLWEKTTSSNSPQLSQEEIQAIHSFVEAGGALLVISEYEHGKYGDNLNELLSPWGIALESNTLHDRIHFAHENHSWILSKPSNSPESKLIAHQVNQACFYQAGTCTASKEAQIVRQSTSSAEPSEAGVMAIATPGKGRVAVVTDSQLFGDEFISAFNHQTLWLNLIYWLTIPAYQRNGEPALNSLQWPKKPVQNLAWISLKKTVNEFRQIQNPEGSIDPMHHPVAIQGIDSILHNLQQLSPEFPHQSYYFSALETDFKIWRENGFTKPDFKNSLDQFHPEKNRIDGIEHLSLFPMYTPNHSLLIKLEAILFRTPWPEWIAELENSRFQNRKFVPGELIDFSEGYESDCAVLFPETISICGKAVNCFGTIFCDREAKRLLHYSRQSLQILKIAHSPKVAAFLSSPLLAQQVVELWDLIHDQAHSLGELPFDPFMIRQRSPYWMYSLEELRVDLRAFREAKKMGENQFPFAEYVTYAILFDRLFRFPIVGTRVRNYDALGGQLLFSFLHQNKILKWCDNQLEIDWVNLPKAIAELEEEIIVLYRNAADSSKIRFWIEAHDLVSRYVKPNIASQWKKESRAINSEEEPNQWLKLIQEDEFPLGQFHLNLQKKIAPH